jgi:hypothetical protein
MSNASPEMASQHLQCDDHVVEPEMVLKYQKRKKLLEKYRQESVPTQRTRVQSAFERMHEIDGCLVKAIQFNTMIT